jgi:hypothetical protein
VPLAPDFNEIVGDLPPDWTDLDFDLRIVDEDRYVEAAVLLSRVNAQPYSKHDWHWRLRVARDFGKAAAAETVGAVLGQLDHEGIAGEMQVREVREGRAPVVQTWGRPESVRQEFRKRHSF